MENQKYMTFKKSLFELCFAFVLTFTVSAQDNTSVNGGEATGNGGTICYSLGQVIYVTASGSSGSLGNGVQQPYEISTFSGVEQTEIELDVLTYPNPATDYLYLSVQGQDLQGLEYQLYNVDGKLLQSDKNISNQTQINMSGLIPSSYFLRITQDNKEIKVFKIIKN